MMKFYRVILGISAAAAAFVQVRAGPGQDTKQWRLESDALGISTGGLRLPDRQFSPQTSRGWQFVTSAARPGSSLLLAAGDGFYWNFELRALAPAAETSTFGMVYRYVDSSNYGVLQWNTTTGILTLRSLRHGRSVAMGTRKIAGGEHTPISLVLRSVMGNLVCYCNGSPVLRGSESALLGRVAVFRITRGGASLDGVEVRSLSSDSDSDVFVHGRKLYETKCANCHELMGPWNSQFAPDDWESVVNEMLSSEHADRYISPTEANQIINYLRIISLCPNSKRYRPSNVDSTR